MIAGALAGASVLVTIFVAELATYGLALRSYLVRRDDAFKRYAFYFIASQIRLAAVAAVIGGVFGAVGTMILHLWLPGESPAWLAAVQGATSTLVFHAWFLARHVIRFPQSHVSWLYAHGGWRRKLMIALTERASPRVVDRAFVACIGACVVVPFVIHYERTRWFAIEYARTILVVAAGVFVLVLAYALTRRRRRSTKRSTKPNLLFLAVDSLRPDRMFAPDAADRFPALAKLASRGVRFREAYVTIARTFSSWAAFLTGRFPQHHGIWHMFPDVDARAAIGSTLVDVLCEHGYESAVISDSAGDIFPRACLGFSDVDAPSCDIKSVIAGGALSFHFSSLPYVASRLGRRLFPEVEFLMELADPEVIADRVIRKIERFAGKPFVMAAFFSTTHFPYAAPYPHYRRFTPPGYVGPYRYGKPWVKYERPPSAADRAQINAIYDAAVASVDAAIARILAKLEASKLIDNTIIVALGDHGEDLYDRPGVGQGHGDNLDGLSNHFPCVIVDPVHGFPPRDVTALVRDVDLAPTLASLLGVELPRVDGTSLVALLEGSRETLNLEAFSSTELWFFRSGPGFERETRLPYPEVLSSDLLTVDRHGNLCLNRAWEPRLLVAMHRAIRTAKWRLTYRPTRSGVRWALHDLEAQEHARDVSAAHPEVVAELRGRLEQWVALDPRIQFINGFAILAAPPPRATASDRPPTLHLRVERGRKQTTVTGLIRTAGSIRLASVSNGEASPTAANELSFSLHGEAGLDVVLDPPDAGFELVATREGAQLKATQILVGEFGLPLLPDEASKVEVGPEQLVWLDTEHGPFLDDHRADSGDLHLWRSRVS